MEMLPSLSRLMGLCSPREIIAYAIWVAHGFGFSAADIDGFSRRVRRNGQTGEYPTLGQTGWHAFRRLYREGPTGVGRPLAPDEVVMPIRGKNYWIRRVVDANVDTLDILVQTRRNAGAEARSGKAS